MTIQTPMTPEEQERNELVISVLDNHPYIPYLFPGTNIKELPDSHLQAIQKGKHPLDVLKDPNIPNLFYTAVITQL